MPKILEPRVFQGVFPPIDLGRAILVSYWLDHAVRERSGGVAETALAVSHRPAAHAGCLLFINGAVLISCRRRDRGKLSCSQSNRVN